MQERPVTQALVRGGWFPRLRRLVFAALTD
jgi:hypothetical protein